LGDVKVKRFLIAILEEELAPIRERRKEWEAKIPEVYALLKKGCDEARAVAADTLADVRRAMKINYFEDVELIEEQARKFAQK
jgi:tryptophanyl-tRNA synthetase